MDREKAATNVRKRSGASGAHAKAAAAKKDSRQDIKTPQKDGLHEEHQEERI